MDRHLALGDLLSGPVVAIAQIDRADRGMVSERTLEAFSKMKPPVHYIVGVRMRRTKEVGEVVLKSRAPWQEVTPERQHAKDPAPLKVKEVTVEGRRYGVCLNEEERRKDAHDAPRSLRPCASSCVAATRVSLEIEAIAGS